MLFQPLAFFSPSVQILATPAIVLKKRCKERHAPYDKKPEPREIITTATVRRAMTSTSDERHSHRMRIAVRNMTLVTWSRYSSPTTLPPLDGSYPITCITIKNPHAEAMSAGHKPVENRTKETALQAGLAGRWMAVSTSAKGDSAAKLKATLPGLLPQQSIDTLLTLDGEGADGAVTAFVYVDRVLTLDEAKAQGGVVSDWATGPHCIVFSTILKLHHPVRVKGALGLWSMVPQTWSTKPSERAFQQGRVKACKALCRALYAGQYTVTRFNGRDMRAGPRVRLGVQPSSE